MKFKRIIASLVAALMLVTLAACSNTESGEDNTSADITTNAPADGDTTADTTVPEPPETTDAPATTKEETTQAPETTTSPEPATVEVKWNFGYVGSSSNSQGYVNKIKPNGG